PTATPEAVDSSLLGEFRGPIPNWPADARGAAARSGAFVTRIDAEFTGTDCPSTFTGRVHVDEERKRVSESGCHTDSVASSARRVHAGFPGAFRCQLRQTC